ncbi:MAG: hypothetical protein WCT12_30520, partial [Verrucomicrobiota bacterium]
QPVSAHRHGEVTQAMIAECHHDFGSIRFQSHLPRQQPRPQQVWSADNVVQPSSANDPMAGCSVRWSSV